PRPRSPLFPTRRSSDLERQFDALVGDFHGIVDERNAGVSTEEQRAPAVTAVDRGAQVHPAAQQLGVHASLELVYAVRSRSEPDRSEEHTSELQSLRHLV